MATSTLTLGRVPPAIPVVLEGKGNHVLNHTDYVTSGGEGSIYVLPKDKTVVKIYRDPVTKEKCDKLTLLKSLSHPSIIAPRGLVHDRKGTPIGYHMYYASGEDLPRMFTNDWWKRSGWDYKDTYLLVERMRDVVIAAHQAGALLVDGNEMNWKADRTTPYVFDVDSWEIGQHKATVIMTSIRDLHAKSFSRDTDWFSWGIVTFQLLVGIHPYRGKLAGYGPGEMSRRMTDNASVFSSGIKLNASVRSLDMIPSGLRAWYESVFQDGVRGEPPSGPYSTPTSPVKRQTVTKTIQHQAKLYFTKLLEVENHDIVRVYPWGMVALSDGTYLSIPVTPRAPVDLSCDAYSVVHDTVIGYTLKEDHVQVSDGSRIWSVPLIADRLFRIRNRVFGVIPKSLIEFRAIRDGGKAKMFALGSSWGLLAHATQFYDDIAISDIYGAMHLVHATPNDGVAMLRIPDLDGLTVLSAKGFEKFIILIAQDRVGGDLYKFEITLDKTGCSIDKIWSGKTDSSEINTTVSKTGVVATIVEDGELILYSSQDPSKLTRIEDPNIKSTMTLYSIDDVGIVVTDGGVLWKVSTKPA